MAMSSASPLALGSSSSLILVEPRVLVAPAGARLPSGVRLLAPVVVAGALPRGAVARGRAAAGDGAAGDESAAAGGEDLMCKFMEAQGLSALQLLAEVVPPALLMDEATLLRSDIYDAVNSARSGSGKPEPEVLVRRMLNLWYRIALLAGKSYPVAVMPQLPSEEGFVALCLGTGEEDYEGKELLGRDIFTVKVGPGVSESVADGIKAVMAGMVMATSAVRMARYVFLGCGGGPRV